MPLSWIICLWFLSLNEGHMFETHWDYRLSFLNTCSPLQSVDSVAVLHSTIMALNRKCPLMCPNTSFLKMREHEAGLQKLTWSNLCNRYSSNMWCKTALQIDILVPEHLGEIWQITKYQDFEPKCNTRYLIADLRRPIHLFAMFTWHDSSVSPAKEENGNLLTLLT